MIFKKTDISPKKKVALKYISLFLILFGFYGCSDFFSDPCKTVYPPDNNEKVSIEQGIWGNVWFWEGDFMPGCPSGKIYPVKRQLYIFEATSEDSVDIYEFGPYFINIRSKLVKIIDSEGTGFFQTALDTGIYSIFIQEDSLFYANHFSDEFIAPVEVKKDIATKIQLDITYKAAY